MKKICFLMDYMIIGGVEKVLCDSIKALSESNQYDITLYIFSGNINSELLRKIEPYAHIQLLDVKFSKRKLILLSIPYISGLFFDWYIKEKYDVCISCRKMFVSSSYSHLSNQHIYWDHSDGNVIYLNNNLSLFRKINKLRLKIMYQHYNDIWVINDEIKKATIEAFGCSQVHTLPNPINIEKIKKESVEACSLKFDKNKINIIYVGRISEEKGVINLLHAINSLKQEYNDLYLYVVGDGNQRKECENYVEKKLMDNVCFLGNQYNPYKYMVSADLLVLPSLTESFGLVLLEAMTLGIPVLATNTVGARDIIKNNKYGYIVENSTNGLKKGIKHFLDNEKEFLDKAGKAKNYALKYDLEVFESKILKYLNNL